MTSTTFPTGQTTERTAADYVDVLKRYWFILVVTTVLSTIISTGFALTQTRVYESSTDILLQSSFSTSVLAGGRVSPTDINTQIRILEGADVAVAVAEELGLNIGDIPAIRGAAVGASSVMRVIVRSTDPALAADVATNAANAYIDNRRQGAIDDLNAAATEVQARIDQIQTEYGSLDSSSTDPVTNSRRQTLLNQESSYRAQLNQLQLTAALRTGDAQIIVRAQTPRDPVAPNPRRSAIVGFMLGLMAGIALAFLLDFSDRAIPDAEVLGTILPAAPILASVPLRPSWASDEDEESETPIAASSPRNAISEAYRSLRTSIMFMSLDSPVSKILVTSAIPGEGKTTTSANLAVVLAQAGHSVILVDADLRRPRQHLAFGVDSTVGLSSVMLGTHSLSEAICEIEEVPGLMVLPAGPIPPSPSELLSSELFDAVLEEIATDYADFVVIDTAPVLPVADASVLASKVEGIVFVVGCGTTDRRDVVNAYERLSSVGGNLLGVVLNRVGFRKGYGYGGYGGYGYGQYGYGQYGQGRNRRRSRYSRYLYSDYGYYSGYRSYVKDEYSQPSGHKAVEALEERTT